MPNNEQRAIRLVMAYEEHRTGKTPDNDAARHIVWDIKSVDRLIEVKSRSAQGISFVILHGNIYKKLTAKQRQKFYLYYVKLGRKPTLTIVKPKVLFSNLKEDLKYLLPASVISRQPKEVLAG